MQDRFAILNQLQDRNILDAVSIILPCVLAVAGGSLALIKEWKSKSSTSYLKDNTIAIIAFGLVLIGASISYFTTRQDKNDKRIAEFQIHQKDSINNAIDDSLSNQQKIIIGLQKDVIKQLTDDGNKPLLSIEKYSNNGYIENGKAYLYNTVSFSLVNSGNHNMKSVSFTISDQYKNIKKINSYTNVGNDRRIAYELYSSTWLQDDQSTNFQQTARFMHEQIGDTTIFVNNLSIKNNKRVYFTTCPKGLPSYEYEVTVDWTNGSYQAFITLDSSSKATKASYKIKVEGKTVNPSSYIYQPQSKASR